ncbi:MAG: hypothetical protein Q9217_001347 [Psora testacea]
MDTCAYRESMSPVVLLGLRQPHRLELRLIPSISRAVDSDIRTKSIVGILDIPVKELCALMIHTLLAYTSSGWLCSALHQCVLHALLCPSVSGIEIGKIIGVFGNDTAQPHNCTICHPVTDTRVVMGFVAGFATTVYLTLGLQNLLGSPKRAIVERAEEMGVEDDNIPLTERHLSNTNPSETPFESSGESIALPGRAHDPTSIRSTRSPPESTPIATALTTPRQDPLPLTRSQHWATYMEAHLDILTYAFLFLVIGLPLYYATTLTFPAHLSLSILSYFLASSLPAAYTRVIHPVLLSSAITILGIYLLALSHRQTLNSALHDYTTKTRYSQVFSGKAQHLPLPGAGDILSSLLDVSIVALALPMYNYRRELRRHFLSIILPNIVLAVAFLFGYPAICNALAISPARSLSFASRSLTLALATPATQNLGGDLQLVAVLCIMSGVMGALLGPSLLSLMKVPESDYVTRGVAMGANGSAIATAVLLGQDPRAAALSSLSMSVLGTVTVGLSSVPPIVGAVKDLVGLE